MKSRSTAPGNLTAALVVVAVMEFVFHRLIERLFLSPGCHGGNICWLSRLGPFFLFLAGTLAIGVFFVALVRHLGRAELFPRGMRFTVAVLSTVFVLLSSAFLFFGRMPERYQAYLETSYGFLVMFLVVSLLGAPSVVPAAAGTLRRAKLGLLLFTLPHAAHVLLAIAVGRAWARPGSATPRVLSMAAEASWLLAGIGAPALLLVGKTSRARLATALGFAAGSSAFFFVALLGRYDLMQTLALYGLRIELPHAASALGVAYTLALFGFVTATTALLLKRGPTRLTGLGMLLVGLAGYQTSSPVELSLSLCGILGMATGILRENGELRGGGVLNPGQWRALLGSLTTALADPAAPGQEPSTIEVVPGDNLGSDDSRIRAVRRGRIASLRFVRSQGVIDSFRVEIGAPGEDTPDGSIETHERWLARGPVDRVNLERVKTGEALFDRKLGVYGYLRLDEAPLRRRLLRHADGVFTFWRGRAARFLTLRDGHGDPSRGTLLPPGPPSTDSVLELLDVLIDILERDEIPEGPSGEGPEPSSPVDAAQ